MLPISSILKKKSKPKQYVGCMRSNRKPKEYYKLLAKTCAHYGLTLIYFTPKGVDMDRHQIKGKVLKEDEWVPETVEVPIFNDVNTILYKHKDIVQYLRQKSTLSNGLIGSKAKQYRLVREGEKFKDIVIPYITTQQPERIMKFLSKHPEVILKPRKGMKGENIYQVTKLSKDQYKVIYDTNEETLTHDDFFKLLYDIVSKKKYICQKYIKTRDENDNPFDVRIRLEKNIEGKWQTAINLVRIASNQKVVSNVAQGGYVSELRPFLKVNYPDQWEEIEEKIIQIGNELPEHIEELIGKNLSSLGIDIGLDPNGKPYLFEINTSPGTEFALGEIANLKAGYYYYRINQLKKQNHQKTESL
ncbi:YheC/YheD family protein [Piscibacillus halophilus]|uniref:YheC/D like ATP-grasp n=1 Tax=Piscibacillus halophilus TaxID=571933 RepID=A0A1H9MUF0_9BACI|nr:YheC/YheD family protein [Piscibacillus halophilus]SER27324.1 YheC/D like ATP-grasp [Piscibacillus halophilus]